MGREMVLSHLKHPDALLVLLRIMKWMHEQSGKNKLAITEEFTFDQDNY